MKYLFAIIIVVGFCTLGFCQTQKALLWELTGTGVFPCYIFGTLHKTDTTIQISDAVRERLSFCNQLVLEAIPTVSIEDIPRDQYSIDIELLNFAQKNNLVIQGLDSEEEAQKIAFWFHQILKKQSKISNHYSQTLLNQQIRLYADQDVDGIHKQTVAAFPSGVAERVLDERNKLWIPRIISFAQSDYTFFAVGASHLGGQNGLINLLRNAGYSLTPIR